MISLYLLTAGVACFCLTLVSPFVEKVGARTLDSRADKRRPGQQPRHLYRVTETDEKTGETRYGFIDKTGRLIIGFDRLPKETAGVGEFQEGRAVIYVRKNESDGKTPPNLAGYIDETGEIVIAPRFDSARGFSEGLAYVEAKGFRGYIDRRGTAVITLKVRDLLDLRIGDVGVEDLAARDFHEGLAAVGSNRRGGKWGYIDHTGRLVVKPQYLFADDFSEGLAGVEIDGNVVRFGFIDKAGKLVIQPRFIPRKGTQRHVTISTSRFTEGLAYVREGELYGFINKRGEFVIPPQFNEAQEFSEGLAWVVASNWKKVGWIDQSGRWVVTGVGGRSFQEELLSVYTERLINWRYSEGLTQFIIISPEGKDLRGYMDRRGKVVIEPRGTDEFGILNPFVGGVALVFFYEKTDAGVASKYGYIDKSGRFIWRSK